MSAHLAGYRPSISSLLDKPIAPMPRYQNQIELLQGTLDLLILQTLQWGPQHGYSIARSINITSGDVLEVDAGSLYPALHRLERQGWVKSRWKRSENQQRVKEYQLTNSGKKQLLSERSRWETLTAAIAGVLKPQED